MYINDYNDQRTAGLTTTKRYSSCGNNEGMYVKTPGVVTTRTRWLTHTLDDIPHSWAFGTLTPPTGPWALVLNGQWWALQLAAPADAQGVGQEVDGLLAYWQPNILKYIYKWSKFTMVKMILKKKKFEELILFNSYSKNIIW